MPKFTVHMKRYYEQTVTRTVEADDADDALEQVKGDATDLVEHPDLSFDMDVPIWIEDETGERSEF